MATANLLSTDESMLDVASSMLIGTMEIDRTGLPDRPGQCGAALDIDGGDDCDELRTPRVETPTIQYCSRRDRRCRWVCDRPRVAASVCALPQPARSYLVDHMRGAQFDV